MNGIARLSFENTLIPVELVFEELLAFRFDRLLANAPSSEQMISTNFPQLSSFLKNPREIEH